MGNVVEACEPTSAALGKLKQEGREFKSSLGHVTWGQPGIKKGEPERNMVAAFALETNIKWLSPGEHEAYLALMDHHGFGEV